MERKSFATSCLNFFGTLARIFRDTWTWQRCTFALRNSSRKISLQSRQSIHHPQGDFSADQSTGLQILEKLPPGRRRFLVSGLEAQHQFLSRFRYPNCHQDRNDLDASSHTHMEVDAVNKQVLDHFLR